MDIQNSYVNLSEPLARYLRELAIEKTGPLAAQAVGELNGYLERFTPERIERDAQVRALAESNLSLSEGALEMAENAVVSEGDDNGAYVMTWSWVSFAGTELDKEKHD